MGTKAEGGPRRWPSVPLPWTQSPVSVSSASWLGNWEEAKMSKNNSPAQTPSASLAF